MERRSRSDEAEERRKKRNQNKGDRREKRGRNTEKGLEVTMYGCDDAV